MNGPALVAWRQQQRQALLAARQAVGPEVRAGWGRCISRALLDGFALLATARLGIYWPIRAEFDPRFVAHHLRDGGATIGLPVVVGQDQPLVYREWHPGTAMLAGGMGIPYPAPAAPELLPDVLLVPPVGFDPQAYRLGYGAGLFDRTLAAMLPRPLTLGVAFECARMTTIFPQPHDIALDFIVTEAGIHIARPDGLELIAPDSANAAALALRQARRNPQR